VRSEGIVLLPPSFDEDLGLLEVEEDLRLPQHPDDLLRLVSPSRHPDLLLPCPRAQIPTLHLARFLGAGHSLANSSSFVITLSFVSLAIFHGNELLRL